LDGALFSAHTARCIPRRLQNPECRGGSHDARPEHEGNRGRKRSLFTCPSSQRKRCGAVAATMAQTPAQRQAGIGVNVPGRANDAKQK